MAANQHHCSLRNLRFKVNVSVSEYTDLESVIVLCLDIGRRYADGAKVRVVIEVYQVLDNLHSTHGAAVRQIFHYSGLDSAVKSLHHGRL